VTITNQQLRAAFLTAPMRHYFEKKLAPVSPAEVQVRVEEALKFLNIAVFCHGSIPVSKEIDEIWHYWILETQEYKKLCRALQGGKFLHHRSNAYTEYFDKDIATRGNDLKHQVAMLSNYLLNYGPFKKDRVKYWLLAAHLVEKCGWSVRQLNGWLTSNQEPRPPDLLGSRRPAALTGALSKTRPSKS
jgi:hypothetical protein